MATDLKISDFRTLVVFQENIVVEENRYSNNNEWYDVYTDRAKIETVTGVIRTNIENPFPIKTHKMFTRYRDDINPTYRVLVGDMAFRIVQVNTVELGKSKYHEWILDQEKQEI